MTKKVSSQDTELFRQAIGKVQRIKHDTMRLTADKKPSPHPRKQYLEPIHPSVKPIDGELEMLGQEDSFRFIVPGLQKNVLKKLRKGFFGRDASIDLHGLTSRAAKQQLLRFLQDRHQEGCRCIRIIHGKGYRSSNQHPVLKNDVNLWLRQHPEVLAFCSAPARDGGSGALLVLLRLAEKYGEQDDTQY